MPATGDDYAEAVRAYNMQYVIPEEREWVTASMQIPHVIDMLEKGDSYSFIGSFITDEGEYRCTRVQFLYYDESAAMNFCCFYQLFALWSRLITVQSKFAVSLITS